MVLPPALLLLLLLLLLASASSASPPVVEEAEEDAVADFTEWLSHNGVNTSAFEVLPTQDGRGRGLFATKPIVAGQVIVSVPISLALGVQAALSHERIGPLLRATLSRAPADFHEDCIATSALLMDAHMKGADSHWAPYLAMLPGPGALGGASPCAGFEAPTKAARAFRDAMPSGMRALCADYEATMDALFLELDGALLQPLLNARYDTKAERHGVFKWAIGVAWSRGQGKVYNASSHSCFLVPGLDHANHAPGAAEHATPLFGAQPYEGTAGLVAARAYAAGAEVAVTYTSIADPDRCQQSVFLQYGFVLPESAGRDCLPVTVPAQLGKAAAGAGAGAGAGAPQNFVLGKDGIPPPAMLDAVRQALRIKPSAAQLVERRRAEEAGEPRTVALQHEKPAVLCGLEGLLHAVEGVNAKCAAAPAAAAPAAPGTAAHPFDTLRKAEMRVLAKARRLVGAALNLLDVDCLQLEAPFSGEDAEIEVTDVGMG